MKPAICIVGAGLVGSLWAVLLQQRGYDVSLFEKRKDIRQYSSAEDRSINLVMTSRGLNGLAKANLLEEAVKLSVPIMGRMIHARSGETQFQPYGNDDECNFSISRAELNKFLLTAAENAGVKLYFEHALDSVDFANKILSFQRPCSVPVHYDVLFGTDGAGSMVRRALCERFPHDFQENMDWLSADYKELWIPAYPDSGDYQIDKNALHIWPRGSHMMMALANVDGSFTVTLYLPQNNHQNAPFHFMMTSQKDIQALFMQDFPDAIPLMPHYISDFLSNPQGKLGTIRCSKWIYQDSVCLMGDAAHAILPFFGQGMNLGFEDCLCFLNQLDEYEENWSLAMPTFEKIQKHNADAIAEMAIENWTEMRDKISDPTFLLRKKVESLLEKHFPQWFKSRYGMVTYTMIPYAMAREIGKIHDFILEKICHNVTSIHDVSLKQAESLLQEHLKSFIQSHQLTLSTDALVANMRRRM